MKVTFNPPKKQDATSDEGIRVLYAPAKRVAFKARWYLILLLAFSPVIILLWYLGREWWLTQAPAIITTEPQLVVANGDGFIRNIYMSPGQAVSQGDALMRFESPTLQANIVERKARLKAIELDKNAAEQAILSNLDEQIRIAERGTNEQEGIYQEYAGYRKEKLVSSAEYASALLSWTQSRIDLQKAWSEKMQQELQIKEDQLTGPLASARYQLEQELTEMQAITRQQQPLSPVTGKVSDVLVQEGDWVFSGAPLALIAKREDPLVIAYVLPKYLSSMEPGHKAIVKLPSGERLAARVARPVELADKLPAQLAAPFEGQKATLKVALSLDEKLPPNLQVEGLPVTVLFD
ncbi:HlyD family secretion protein [Aeromonas australiensis]|uniref:HlyD family secretion protein n=1 Tax=Aeromonas australiensis TaxID=1114880 RepID=UPI00058A2BBA|nr:HlyD family efflux transporter periplasmic adaptor subunit [Aeromonas australiensis]